MRADGLTRRAGRLVRNACPRSPSLPPPPARAPHPAAEYEAHLTSDLPAPNVLATASKQHTQGTHIVCTLGPSSRTVEQCEDLLRAGMSVARFNFSHGSYEYHSETLANLRKASENTGIMCAVLQDTKGPEVRTGFLESGDKCTYEMGSEVTITADYEAKGNPNLVAVSYKDIASTVSPGSKILCADGSLMFEVLSCNPDAGTVQARALNTATIGERKNCNLPGAIVNLPVLTEKDKADLTEWGLVEGIDFLAASFVRKASDVQEVRETLGADSGVRIISKIENQEALDNIDEIIRESDGIMVARGDLGMEIPLEKMFEVQKDIIRRCNIAGKPVVTATQMLESMVNNPRPTRAEATDVANAVLDGTDSVMLSGETAAGAFPVEAVTIMASITREAERCIDNTKLANDFIDRSMEDGTMSDIESLASSAVQTALKTNAKAIVCLAASGVAARLISKYRPSQPVIVGVVPREARAAIGFRSKTPGRMLARQCLISRGLIPVMVSPKDTDVAPAAAAKQAIEESIAYGVQQGVLEKGDKVVTLYNVEKQCAVIRMMTCE